MAIKVLYRTGHGTREKTHGAFFVTKEAAEKVIDGLLKEKDVHDVEQYEVHLEEVK